MKLEQILSVLFIIFIKRHTAIFRHIRIESICLWQFNSFTTEWINHSFSLAKNILPLQDKQTIQFWSRAKMCIFCRKSSYTWLCLFALNPNFLMKCWGWELGWSYKLWHQSYPAHSSVQVYRFSQTFYDISWHVILPLVLRIINLFFF